MAFKIGDLVTGTVDNEYGYTTRGAICRVVGYGSDYSDDKSIIRVRIIGFDDDIVRDGSFLSMEPEEGRRKLIRDETEYPVKACLFEPYHLYVEEGAICELNDFLEQM